MTSDRPLPDRPSLFVRATDVVGRTIIRSLTRVRVEGLEHARGLSGPVIVAVNHLSNADGPLVTSWLTPAIGRRLYLATATVKSHQARIYEKLGVADRAAAVAAAMRAGLLE